MTYVISDIHGNMKRFRELMERINLQPEDTLYILGDVIDRHPGGIKILREIMAMPNAKMLLGNHEYMMLQCLAPRHPKDEDPWESECENNRNLRIWYKNGGDVTHQYLKHIRKDVRREIFAYLKALPLNIDIEVNGRKFKLVHASPTENFLGAYKRYYNSLTEFSVWERWEPTDRVPEGCTMIFGHTPTCYFQQTTPFKIWSEDERAIGIDCGCGYADTFHDLSSYCRLGCLRLDDMKEFYSDVGVELK